MKKVLVWILALVAVLSAVAFPALAENPTETTSVSDKVDLLPHLHPWRHKFYMIWDAPEDTRMWPIDFSEELSQESMEDVMAEVDFDLFPEARKIHPESVLKIESQRIVCQDGEKGPFTVTFRVWDTKGVPIMVFYVDDSQGEVDDEDWQLLTIQDGMDVTVEFPRNGRYAIGRVW